MSAAPRPATRSRQLFEASERTEIQVQVFWRETGLARQIVNRFLELHQCDPDLLDLFWRQRAFVHAPDRLTLHHLADEVHEREHQLHDRPPHVFGIGIPVSWRHPRFDALLELFSQNLEVFDVLFTHPRSMPTFGVSRSSEGVICAKT